MSSSELSLTSLLVYPISLINTPTEKFGRFGNDPASESIRAR